MKLDCETLRQQLSEAVGGVALSLQRIKDLEAWDSPFFNELWARRRPLLPGKWWRRASVAGEGLGSCDQELQGSLTRSLEAHA